MSRFVVRNIEKEVKLGLQRRAARHGRSMEEEVREVLRNAVNYRDAASGRLGTEIASLFAKVGLDEHIPELHGYGIEQDRKELAGSSQELKRAPENRGAL